MSIERKGPNKWRIVVPRYYDSDGKRVCHYETFLGNKKEAELREGQIKLEISNNTYVKKTKMTMGRTSYYETCYFLRKSAEKTDYADDPVFSNVTNPNKHLKLKQKGRYSAFLPTLRRLLGY